MNGALYVGKTGMDSISKQMNELANNIANSQTPGFKTSRVNFATLMSQNIRETSSVEGGTPTGLQLGTGVKVTGTQKNFETGAPINTDGELDIMITGEGFVPVQRETGETYYTRAGNFTRDRDGMVVTQGNLQVGDGIMIPEDTRAIRIDRNGEVNILQDGDAEFQNIGQLEVVRFINPAGLREIGDNMYEVTETSGDPMYGIAGEFGFGEILQGYVEGSNVNMGEQLVQLIETQNAYEMNSKVISKTGEMMAHASQQIG